MHDHSQDNLSGAFAARAAADLVNTYANWSSTYDDEAMRLGYCLPFVITAWVARYAESLESKILDAGCGTGLTGQYLAELGYGDLHGLDFSPEMLERAGRRGVYRSLTRGELGKALDWQDATFDLILSAGVFTQGHAPASSFDELLRILKPGGYLTFTIRDITLETHEFDGALKAMLHQRRASLVEKSPPFRSFTTSNPDIAVNVMVLQKL